MKTLTRSNIIKIIQENHGARPSELAKKLKITPQAIHRHLRVLILEGIIEIKGKPPSTEYVIADSPRFDAAFEWFKGKSPSNFAQFVCETRDVFTARLNRVALLQKQGVSIQDLSLIISTIGEIGNNSFDHNLGHWVDAVGCWFEFFLTKNRLWMLIADRGQGIRSSLSRVAKDLSSDDLALKTAFEERISGRAPENRGNGLKYVKKNIIESLNRGIACKSGNGIVQYGTHGPECASILKGISKNSVGTITIITWSLK